MPILLLVEDEPVLARHLVTILTGIDRDAAQRAYRILEELGARPPSSAIRTSRCDEVPRRVSRTGTP
jgi:chemotaxis response regulator CheB